MTYLFLVTYFIIGLLNNHEMKTLSGEEFYEKFNSVYYNFDVINCSEDDL